MPFVNKSSNGFFSTCQCFFSIAFYKLHIKTFWYSLSQSFGAPYDALLSRLSRQSRWNIIYDFSWEYEFHFGWCSAGWTSIYRVVPSEAWISLYHVMVLKEAYFLLEKGSFFRSLEGEKATSDVGLMNYTNLGNSVWLRHCCGMLFFQTFRWRLHY